MKGKTLRIDKNGQFYPINRNRITRKGVEVRVNTVKRDYMRRAEKLDISCNNEINTKPFSNALKNDFETVRDSWRLEELQEIMPILS